MQTNSGCYLGIYTVFNTGQVVFVFLSTFSLALAGVYASRSLHSSMLKNILRSPMSFFDTTPLGRVLNRFSKDIYIIDEAIPTAISQFLYTLFVVLSTLLVIIIVTPTFAIVILPLGVFYFLVQVNSQCSKSFFLYIAIIMHTTAFLCGHLSSAEASGVYHSLSHLLSLPGVPPGSIQHPGLPSARQVHEGE